MTRAQVADGQRVDCRKKGAVLQHGRARSGTSRIGLLGHQVVSTRLTWPLANVRVSARLKLSRTCTCLAAHRQPQVSGFSSVAGEAVVAVHGEMALRAQGFQQRASALVLAAHGCQLGVRIPPQSVARCEHGLGPHFERRRCKQLIVQQRGGRGRFGASGAAGGKRSHFQDLKAEIASAGGNVQPIKVRPAAVLNGSTPPADLTFELIYGHRRHRVLV